MHRQAVRGVDVEHERAIEPDRAAIHSSTRAGEQVAGHVAQRLAVEVDLLLREEQLEVADQVDEHEAHEHDAGDRHDPLLADRRSVEAHGRRAGTSLRTFRIGRPAAFSPVVGGVVVVAIVTPGCGLVTL